MYFRVNSPFGISKFWLLLKESVSFLYPEHLCLFQSWAVTLRISLLRTFMSLSLWIPIILNFIDSSLVLLVKFYFKSFYKNKFNELMKLVDSLKFEFSEFINVIVQSFRMNSYFNSTIITTSSHLRGNTGLACSGFTRIVLIKWWPPWILEITARLKLIAHHDMERLLLTSHLDIRTFLSRSAVNWGVLVN